MVLEELNHLVVLGKYHASKIACGHVRVMGAQIFHSGENIAIMHMHSH